jgi:hypothetical protein
MYWYRLQIKWGYKKKLYCDIIVGTVKEEKLAIAKQQHAKPFPQQGINTLQQRHCSLFTLSLSPPYIYTHIKIATHNFRNWCCHLVKKKPMPTGHHHPQRRPLLCIRIVLKTLVTFKCFLEVMFCECSAPPALQFCLNDRVETAVSSNGQTAKRHKRPYQVSRVWWEMTFMLLLVRNPLSKGSAMLGCYSQFFRLQSLGKSLWMFCAVAVKISWQYVALTVWPARMNPM